MKRVIAITLEEEKNDNDPQQRGAAVQAGEGEMG